ncbi:MAG TPA: potassium transporter Kup [Gemmatimonadales bacterium]|nr:potassium transporter Kup [Gemmatimonadales bacterium]
MSHGAKVPPRGRALAGLAVAALGVVYGDIGTSPLYALKECFAGPHGVAPSHENVLGVLSLVFWSLNIVVSFKYLSLVMRADNRGEGGILALLALVRKGDRPSGAERALVAAGLFGAALLYGDGIITPAISVLGAVEGLSIATPAVEPFIVWIAVVIIGGLFAVQSRGTARVGTIFGPLTGTWFLCIAVLGIRGILIEPSVLLAVNPWYAVQFFLREGAHGFVILAAVVLVVTGGEALYADMGHFGRRPIRLAWFSLVLPALMLNYMGQGALLLAQPEAARNPFYTLVPGWALYPMVAVATAATIVASQALISGAYSLTRQAVQLGYSPRVNIVHTSSTEMGQIYIPQVNTMLMIACIGLVLSFRTASNLAAAYGVAVAGTMTITAVLFAVVTRALWRWPLWKVFLVVGPLLLVDLAFFTSNLQKIPDGGWFPLVVAGLVYTLMSAWKRGRNRLAQVQSENTLPIELFLDDIARRRPPRVPGVAVFLTSVEGGAPPVLLHHLKHNKVLHERVVLMSVRGEEIPQVGDEERVACRELGEGFYQVVARYGFMETPDVPAALRLLAAPGAEKPVTIKPMEASFYLGRETIIPSGKGWMANWWKRLFTVMSRNAQSAAAFFNLPPNRVVELGAQIQL